ncbi:MAG: hypothetical protein QOG87_1569, partial [Actinomycetota bacterium]
MRVLHIQKATGIGGSERHLVDLLRGLRDLGTDVHMCVLGAPGHERFVDALADADVETSVVAAGTDLSPALVGRIGAQVRRLRPDVVHTHLIHADVHGQVAARLARVPGVSTIHGPQPFYRRQPFKAAARTAGHLARRTIVISEYLRGVVAELRLAPADRVRVVHYGITAEAWASTEGPSLRASLGLHDGALVVGVASRLIAGKGHDVAIDAVARARETQNELVLLVAGDGALRTELEARAARAGAGAVRFLGFVPDLRGFMTACDVVVVPTLPELGEGFGLVALEAMAAGRPVVVSDTASLPEVVDQSSGV